MKALRPPIIVVALLASLTFLSLASGCLWFAAIRPYKEREQRIALATSFLEAYSERDCARAKALMDPAKPLTSFHSPDLWNPETFCQEYRIRIIELDNIQEVRTSRSMSWPGRAVRFSGKFEITDYGVGPYPCPHVQVSIDSIDNEWVVTGWHEDKGAAGTPGGSLCVSRIHEPTRAWPQCFDAPGVSLQLHRIDNTRIELVAEGLDTEGVLHIFYRPTAGSDFRGEVSMYQGQGGGWVQFRGGEVTNIDPMVNGRFVYTLKDLPPLPHDSTWEVRLAYRWGVACAQITLP